MTTRFPRLRVAALVFATLGFGACSAGRDDHRGSQDAGVTASYPASDDTLRAAGIASWEVTVLDVGGYLVVGRGSSNESVARMRFHWSETSTSLTLEEPASGTIELDPDGNVVDTSIEDAEAYELIGYFAVDGDAMLAEAGFRAGPACIQAIGNAVMACAKAAHTKAPMDVLACIVNIAKAAQACGGGGMMPGGTMSGGSMSGGSMSGGTMSGGDSSGGNSGESGDSMSGGSGESGGGSGESGGYETGGSGESGYGSSGGYESGGYETGGTGGYESGGYNSSYNSSYGSYGSGYNSGGYGYDIPEPTPTLKDGTISANDPALGLVFGGGGAANKPLNTGAWNMRTGG